MNYHTLTSKQTIDSLSSDAALGLSYQQAQERLQQYGENKLRDQKKKSNLQRFFDQFKDAMILILILAAIVSLIIACTEGDLK